MSQFDLTPEQIDLRARAAAFAQACVKHRAAEVDRSEAYPWDIVAQMSEAGFFGMTIPRAYGGKGAGFLEAALVVEEMSKACGVSRCSLSTRFEASCERRSEKKL